MNTQHGVKVSDVNALSQSETRRVKTELKTTIEELDEGDELARKKQALVEKV